MSLIDREKTLKRLLEMADQTRLITTESVEYVLESEPSAQPGIIRCKDCKHWLDIDDGRQKHSMCADIYGDWFCADAERRTDECSNRQGASD